MEAESNNKMKKRLTGIVFSLSSEAETESHPKEAIVDTV